MKSSVGLTTLGQATSALSDPAIAKIIGKAHLESLLVKDQVHRNLKAKETSKMANTGVKKKKKNTSKRHKKTAL